MCTQEKTRCVFTIAMSFLTALFSPLRQHCCYMALPRGASAKVLSSQKSLSRISHPVSRAQGYRHSSSCQSSRCHHSLSSSHSHYIHSSRYNHSSRCLHSQSSSHSLQAPHMKTQLRQWREIRAQGVRRSSVPASISSLLSILLCSITGRQ